jgi:hypothetical protein
MNTFNNTDDIIEAADTNVNGIMSLVTKKGTRSAGTIINVNARCLIFRPVFDNMTMCISWSDIESMTIYDKNGGLIKTATTGETPWN